MIVLEIKERSLAHWKTTSNQLHRLNRPARFWRYCDGKKLWEEWYQFGNSHRDSDARKPAITIWNPDGTLYSRSYWKHGEFIRIERL